MPHRFQVSNDILFELQTESAFAKKRGDFLDWLFSGGPAFAWSDVLDDKVNDKYVEKTGVS